MFGHYQLIRELGRGGMGTVFLARDTRLGRRVAIKLLTHQSPAAKRFQAEARATARCKHDNIVSIHDVGEEHGHSYMVLEYIEGITLRAWLEEHWQPDPFADTAEPMVSVQDTPVSQTLAAEMMLPVVRALVHAHARGLIHRDLKPANVMLADSGSFKVLDFGIAKALQEQAQDSGASDTGEAIDDELGESTAEGALVGTLPYMSPEQWNGLDLDGRSDLWAAGIMLWELATGQHPLEPLSRQQLMTVRDTTRPMPLLAERHPELQPLAGIVDRCLRKPTAERMESAAVLLDELEQLTALELDSGDAPSDNPYVSLAAFQRHDAARFFGRERDITRLLGQLRNHRLVTVAGPSGAGKSSLLRAGVIPALERSGQKWKTYIIRPGRKPLDALAGVARDIHESSRDADADISHDNISERLIEQLRTQPGYLGTRMRKLSQQRQTRVLLMVDQFEELYTLGADREERAAFIACLEGVADDASSPLRVALSLRSDFFDRVAEDSTFSAELTEAFTLLGPMQRLQLRDALTRPLQATGYRFESEALVDTMLDELQAAHTPLPLLQFTAAQLWERRDLQAQVITQASHDELGGVAGALAGHADAVLKAMPPAEQLLARGVCTALVSEERTRAIVSLTELRNRYPANKWEAVDACVQRLARARLVLIENDERGTTAELVHESLIERWPSLVRWLEEDQEASRFHVQLQAAARQWDRQGRSADLLWRGQAAGEAARWVERDDGVLPELPERARDYLNAVVDHAQRAQRRRRRVWIVGMASVTAIAIVVSLLALKARREARQARKSEAEAQRSESVARAERQTAARRAVQARNASRLASAILYQSDATLSLALIREMEPHEQLPPQWRQLARAAIHQDLAEVVLTHQDVVSSAAFSPDGRRIVTAIGDKTAQVWNADGSGEPLLLEGHNDLVATAAFSPDGRRIVTSSFDKTARVWNADGSGEPLLLEGHNDLVYSAVFSPDGRLIVTASEDKTARVWQLAQPAADGSIPFVELIGHEGAVASGSWGAGAFSPDSKRVLTLSDDKTLRIWNADGHGEPAILNLPDFDAFAASFSPDGTRIVTASHNKRDPVTDKKTFAAIVWPSFERFTGLDDPALWTATRYCPPIKLRMDLLGMPAELAEEHLAQCQARVKAAFDAKAARP